MLNNQQPLQLREMAFNALAKQGLFKIDLPVNIKLPAGTSSLRQQDVESILEQMILEKLMAKFLQAVVDDERATVAAMLYTNPDLAFIDPPPNLIIESKWTWQKFYAENALQMAVKRQQIDMIEVLLPYYDELEQTEYIINTKIQALSAWKVNEIQKDAYGNDEVIIPPEYAYLAQSLVNTFQSETFPNGIPDQNGTAVNVALSEQTELALSSLLNILVPKQAVKLDEHVDVELLLYAIFAAYRRNFNTFDCDWNRLNAICVRVMGLIQSALPPETGKIWCEGLYNVIDVIEHRQEKQICVCALSHKLKSGQVLYRRSRDARFGCGFDFVCGDRGNNDLWGPNGSLCANPWFRPWAKPHIEILSNKNQRFFGALRRHCARHSQTDFPQVISRLTV